MAPDQLSPVRRIHTSGFIVLDLLVADGTMRPIVGGTAANVAINCSLLGWDASVTALLGDDAAGHSIRRQLEEYGVNTDGVVHDGSVETPVLVHEVGPKGHRFRFSCPNCGAKYAKFRPLPPVEARTAPTADVHFFDRASSYANKIAAAHSSSSLVVFEPGTPGRPPATASLAASCAFFRASADLDLDLDESVLATKAQVIGLGAEGVKYRVPDESTWSQMESRSSAEVIDAGGAGDWLTAGILTAVDLERLANSPRLTDLEPAISLGLELAAACCEHSGTRGQVGTEFWRELGDRTPGVRTVVPDVHTFDLGSGHTGCDFWFHNSRK